MFEIGADEISDLWDSVAADEEPMGTRTTWEASIELPELGTLTWQLWEYPEGVFNGTDTDVDGHELVSDFQITLEHDPEDSDAREADEAAIDEMIEWFHQNYEDPANRVPYESAEGGYQWIFGGPETPEEALGDNFGSVHRQDLIEQAATKITDDSGIYDWSPIPGADWADDYQPKEESPMERRERLAAEIAADAASILQTLRPLVEIEKDAREDRGDGLVGIGHNNPPEPIEELGFPPAFFAEMSKATAEIAAGVAKINAAAEQSAGTAEALREVAAAQRQNTAAINANTEALQKQSEEIAKAAKTGKYAVGIYVADKVLGEVLAKIGEELASWSFPVMRSAAEGLGGYLLEAAASIGAFAGKVTEYLSMFV
ncbi:hypothetical protein [Cereibacter johrii]|uniref:hypothetical protein n=1 Tax=Cereibacter johrii TaxID=445629 RepID=UPI0011BEF996|nr:hypothetical protein [Cereibacter johrii]